MHGRRRRAEEQWDKEDLLTRVGATFVRRAGHVRRQIHCIYLSWPAVAGVKRPIGRQQVAQARRVEEGGVLRHARALKVHVEDLHEAVVLHSSLKQGVST